MLLCGRIFLGAKYPPVLFPRILARKDCAREVHTCLNNSFRWTPFFPGFFWCQVPLENLTACFDPNFPSTRRIDFLGYESSDTQRNCVDSFNNATVPFAPPFFDNLLGFSSASTRLKKHVLPKFASCLRRVVLTHGRMPKHYMTGFYNFCDGTEFRSICLKSFHLCCLVFEDFLPRRQSWPSNLVRERTIVFFISDHRTKSPCASLS